MSKLMNLHIVSEFESALRHLNISENLYEQFDGSSAIQVSKEDPIN
jgi:hypothetical protein